MFSLVSSQNSHDAMAMSKHGCFSQTWFLIPSAAIAGAPRLLGLPLTNDQITALYFSGGSQSGPHGPIRLLTASAAYSRDYRRMPFLGKKWCRKREASASRRFGPLVFKATRAARR